MSSDRLKASYPPSLDDAGWAAANGEIVNCFEPQLIPASVFQEVAVSQNITVLLGDILFTRTGWTPAYRQLPQAQPQQLADYAAPPVIGV
ncbi:hypothetical protein PITC_084400 [Penicillium italicum]|uniref:Uncharacterized protein n=1 Tax=Penicillium italicum TaxID=40296 RepID=A0A0A2L4U5_PENIT|nr:hypothetical protein PITC_084400 [Penicillium italicum]